MEKNTDTTMLFGSLGGLGRDYDRDLLLHSPPATSELIGLQCSTDHQRPPSNPQTLKPKRSGQKAKALWRCAPGCDCSQRLEGHAAGGCERPGLVFWFGGVGFRGFRVANLGGFGFGLRA